MDRYQKFSIELDCPPGGIRPADLIGSVLRGTGLEIEDFETAPPFFGHQTWILKEAVGKDKLYTDTRATLKARVTALYETGQIRFGSW